MTGANGSTPDLPELSIVVTVVDGGDVLRRFLDALLAQVDPPSTEIILPFDASVPEIAELADEYPAVRFLPMGAVETIRPKSTAAGQHELYDRRRAAGLHAARAVRLIAILEDRAPPRANWSRTMARLHATLPNGAIGGAIESSATDDLNWAFYACDFTRYCLPFESGVRDWISDVNVCYKRDVILALKHVWNERFNEAKVHWTLTESGERLYLTNEAIVDYITPYRSLWSVLPERFGWGRLFGHVRAKHVSVLQRLRFILAGPAIPVVLFFRHARLQSQRGNLGRFLHASPLVIALLVGWSSGEIWGYITKRP